jgi:hypothetical protein
VVAVTVHEPAEAAESSRDRILRVAECPATQALVDTAPPPTREQLDAVRAACSSASARFRAAERSAIASGR